MKIYNNMNNIRSYVTEHMSELKIQIFKVENLVKKF